MPAQPQPGSLQGLEGLLGEFGISPEDLARQVAGARTQVALEPQVYWGKGAKVRVPAPVEDVNEGDFFVRGGEDNVRQYLPGREQVRSITEAMADVYTWDEETRKANRGRIEQALGIELETFDDLVGVWQSLVKHASSAYTDAGQELTPWDILELNSAKGWLGGARKPKPGEEGFYGWDEQTQTSTQINLTDAATARQIALSALQEHLGRAPTKAEEREFLDNLHDQERANPQKVREVRRSRYEDGRVVESNSTQTTLDPGVNPEAMANEWATEGDNSKEYGEFQAAGTYMPLLMAALASTVDV